MTMDSKGNDHKAAGRTDGGQFDRKAGQGSDDDDGIDPETARHIRYAIRLTPDRDPDRVFADMRRNGVDSMLDRYVD